MSSRFFQQLNSTRLSDHPFMLIDNVFANNIDKAGTYGILLNNTPNCQMLFTYRWSRIKTGYLHIWSFYYIFINHKFIPFAITHRISKCLEYIIRKFIKLRYVRT